MGGEDLLPAVHRELTVARALLTDADHGQNVTDRLRTIVGELAQLAGWTASDAGRTVEAERLYLMGVGAVQDTDPVLAAQLLSSLSYQMATVGRPADALLLARSAVRGAVGASPLVTALLHERVAWAAARARDHDRVRRALDTVDAAFADRGGTPEPEWVYWLDQAEIDVMAGRCMVELGDPATAEPLLTRAVAGYDGDHVREVALYRTWLAQAYAATGELDAARTTWAQAADDARTVGSARLTARIRAVEPLLRR